MTDQLSITIEGATAEEIERGLAAARQVFEGAGCTAWEAASASWRRNLLDEEGVFALADAVLRLREGGADPADVAAAEAELAWLKSQPGMHSLTRREDEIAEYWAGADQAAVRACCAGWAEVPETANLDVAPPKHDAPEGDDDPAKQIEAMQERVGHQMVAGHFVAMARDL